MALDKLRFDSGRLCLDLLATVGSRLGTDPIERLSSSERLQQWLVGSGLVPAGQPLAFDAEPWLAELKEIRALLHRVIHRDLRGQQADVDDVRRLNDRAATAPPAPQLATEQDGPRQRLVEPVTLPAIASAVCRDAIELLTGPERPALRECEGGTCDLVYLDHSRGRRRRWCSAASCGNRDRVARYRDRRRRTGPVTPAPGTRPGQGGDHDHPQLSRG